MPLPVSLWEEVRAQSHRGAGRAVNRAGVRGNVAAREARPAHVPPELGETSDGIPLPEELRLPTPGLQTPGFRTTRQQISVVCSTPPSPFRVIC